MTQNVVKTNKKVKKCEKQNNFYTSISVHQSNLRPYDKSQNNHEHGVQVVMDTTCKYRQFLKVVLCLNEYISLHFFDGRLSFAFSSAFLCSGKCCPVNRNMVSGMLMFLFKFSFGVDNKSSVIIM